MTYKNFGFAGGAMKPGQHDLRGLIPGEAIPGGGMASPGIRPRTSLFSFYDAGGPAFCRQVAFRFRFFFPPSISP